MHTQLNRFKHLSTWSREIGNKENFRGSSYWDNTTDQQPTHPTCAQSLHNSGCIVSALWPWWRVVTVALLAGSVATSVEFLKLYHAPWLDSFRITVPGVILLGRVFSVWDILAYWLAMILGAVLDGCIRPKSPLALNL